jgi:anti-sigma-K factor RskA
MANELWLIDESGPRPMNVLERADDGEIRDSVELDRRPTAWGITLEPASGSASPTGEILFVAQL